MTAFSIDGYRIDLMTVTPSYAADVAGDVLESGARYIDHVQRRATTLRIEGTVSDYPVGEMVAIRDAERANAEQSSYRPSAFAYQRLQALIGGGPVDVVLGEVAYIGYVLESFEPEAPEHPHALRFTASAVEWREVSLERQVVAVAVPTATGKKNLGFDPSRVLDSLATGAINVLRDAAGGPVQIFDRDGNMAAWRNSRTGTWFDKQGREVDPFDSEQLDKLRDPNKPLRERRTGQLLSHEGVPITRTSAAKARPSSIPRPNGSTDRQPSDEATQRALSRALPPSWDFPFGPVR